MAGVVYTARISVIPEVFGEEPLGDPELVATVALTVAAGAAGSLPAPSVTLDPLGKSERDRDPRVCCPDVGGAGCGFPTCEASMRDELPNLSGALELGDDALLTQSYVRTYSGVGGVAESDGAVLGVASDHLTTTIGWRFDATADEYCLGVELVSFIDGSVSSRGIACTPHGGLELGAVPNDNFDAFIESCEAPYWEDTMEPYVPGSSSDDRGDTDGGSDDGASSGESGDDGSGSLDGDARGCACTGGGPASTDMLSLGVFVLLGLTLRRRRR